MKVNIEMDNLEKLVADTMSENIENVIKDEVDKYVRDTVKTSVEKITKDVVSKNLTDFAEDYIKNTQIKIGGGYWSETPEETLTVEQFIKRQLKNQMESKTLRCKKEGHKSSYNDDFENVTFETYINRTFNVATLIQKELDVFMNATKKEINDKIKDSFVEWNPLTVHYTKRNKCPHCGSENIEKTRSSLLVEYLRVIRAKKPNFGIYENVKNIVGKQFKETTFKLFTDELEEYGYNIYWKVLNAKDYGVPQNRERVYLIFIRKDLDNGKFKFPEPFDNGIRLKDVLEDEVNEKYYLSDDKVQKFIANLKVETVFDNDIHNEIKQVGNMSVDNSSWNNPQAGRIYSSSGISPTLNTCGGGQREPKIIQVGNINSFQDGVVVSPDGIAKTHTSGHNNAPKTIQICVDKSINNSKEIDYANCITSREDRGVSNRGSEGTAVLEIGRTDTHQKGGIYSTEGLSPTLFATMYKQPVQIGVNKIGNVNPSGNSMNGNVFSDDGLAPTLTTNKGEGNKVAIKQATKKGYIKCEIGGVADLSYPNSQTRRGRVQENGTISPTITATETGICRIESDIRIRKLIPLECFRLMGFTDEEFFRAMIGLSDKANEFIEQHPHLIGKTILDEAETIQGISNSQLYKMSGNSIVVDVLYYIYVEIYKAMPYLFDDLRLSSFFSGIGAFESGLDRLFENIRTGNFM